MALLFLGVLIVFTASILTSSLMMSGPNSPVWSDLSPLDYQVWGQCWSLNTSCNRSQNQFSSFKMLFS